MFNTFKSGEKYRRRSLFLPVTLLIFTVATDLLSKIVAERVLAHSNELAMLGGLITLSLVKNFEGFLGIARGLPPSLQFFFLYICVTLLLICCLVFLFLNRADTGYDIPLTLVAGGGLSNLLDRLFNAGGVTDFMIITLGKLHTGIFNLADVYILIGSFLFGFSLFSRVGR